MSEILNIKIKEKGLVNIFSISNLARNSEINTKLTILAAKAELKAQQGNRVKLPTFLLSYFRGKNFSAMLAFKIFLFINQHLVRWV